MRVKLRRDKLAELLARRQISQNRWAQILRISRGHLSDLLNGRHVHPSARTRRKLLQQLEVPFEDLFEIEPAPTPHIPPDEPLADTERLIRHFAGDTSMNGFFSALRQDLTFAARFFARNRGLSLAAVLTLGLGIGASTALFSVVHAVMLEKLPVRDPQDLVLFRFVADHEISTGITSGWNLDTPEGLRSSTSFTYPSYLSLRQQRDKLKSVFASAAVGRLTLYWNGKSEQGLGQLVSGNYFQGLGVHPAVAGRLIGTGDDSPEAPPVAVLSYSYWKSRFSGDAEVVGKAIQVNQMPFTIAGVAPEGFEGTLQLGSKPQVFIPLTHMERLHGFKERTRDADAWWLQIMGRMDPGVERREAQAALNVLFQQSIRQVVEQGNADKDLSKLVYPQLQLVDGDQGPYEVRQYLSRTIAVAAILVGLVLLLAGVNAAALLIAKAARRRREMAVRLSLGANRWRLIRQLATESVLLALAAGAAGLIIAYWGKELMAGLVAARNSLGTALDVSLNLPVLLFALGISLLTGVLFGVLPAVRTSGVDPAPALKESDRSVTLTRSTRLLGRGLSVVQVALAVVVLVTAGLLLRTLTNLMSVDPGFDPENLLAFEVNPSSGGYDPQSRLEFYESFRHRLEELSEIRSVSYSSQTLLGGGASSLTFLINGKTDYAYLNHAGPSFFETLGIPILSGRDFDSRDSRAMPTAIVSRALVDKFFPHENPLGRIVEASLPEDFAAFFPGLDQRFQIVGVVGNTKYADLREEAHPTVFLPARQNGEWMKSAYMFVRLAAAPDRVIPEIERTLQGLDRRLPITDMQTYRTRIRDSMDQERQFAKVTSFFGIAALLLVSIGLYGTLSHAVACRRREFGVRQALGASRRRIVQLVMREILVVAIGLGIGVASSLAVTQVLSSLVFGLSPRDPATIVIAGLILIAVATTAVYLPARRAARVDPVVALRSE